MAVPLSELKFHKPPKPITNEDQDVPDDIMEMGNFLQDQYGFAHPSIMPKKVEFSASALIPLWITGKDNDVPTLVSTLWDIYCQWKLSKIAESKHNPNSLTLPGNFSFEYFLLYSPLGENMNFGHKKLKLCVRGINEYYFNYFWPISRTPTSFIHDSFAAYTKYAIAISQCVNAIIGKADGMFPLHFDFWIIPKNVMVCEGASASDSSASLKRDEDVHLAEQTDDVIMNIEKRLKLGDITYTKTGIKNFEDMSSIGISQLISRKIMESLKAEKGQKSHRRVMSIIDRRSAYYDFVVEDEKEQTEALDRKNPPLIECDTTKDKLRNIKDNVFVYEVDNKYGHIPEEYIQERLLFNTQQWVMPFCRIKRDKKEHKLGYELDGGTNYCWKNQIFVLSFHVNSAKDVKVYWHLNGNMMRFLPHNIADIWPLFFYKDKQMKKEIKEFDTKVIQKGWKLKVTDAVYDQYCKELIPQHQ
eukprot:176454_1